MEIGSRIGRYEVVETLGAGGMGVVYRARDAKLNRDVALKVLADAVIHDPVRVARFEREAQVLASLNHPNIGSIYGVEEAPGVVALVLELVEGPTLADRLVRGPLPTAEALAVATQIADALASAHDRGIVHRDLKPANIKLRPDGTVKVLDFGLAKAVSDPSPAASDLSHSPTLTSAAMTRAGVILGTAAYMSPEQAAGRDVDRRTDLWAFGVVLFEMLTGRPVFTGETASHVIADVLRGQPEFDALPPDTPVAVRRLLRRCLEKDPRRRLDSAAAARLELDDTAPPPADVESAGVPGRRWTAAIVVLALLGGAAIGAVAMRTLRPATAPARRVTRFTIGAQADLPLRLSVQAAARDFAVAPDGSFLVYRAGDRGQLALRWFDRVDAVPIEGVAAAAMPFVSPDSRWIGFVDNDLVLKKVAVAGGEPITLAQLPVWPRGASWVDDSTIIVGTNSTDTGLMRVPAGGGEPVVLTRPDREHGEEGHVLPAALPGGRAVLFTIGGAEPQNAQIAVLDLATGKYSSLLRGGRDAQYVASGHLLYMSGLALAAVRFDADARRVIGEPVRVIDNVGVAPTAALNVAVTRDGTMLLAQNLRGSPARRTLAWLDRDGRETPIPAPPRAYESARLSPDGTAVAVSIRDQENDVWMWSFARQTLTRLTFDPDVDLAPVWTPDGKRVVFASARSGAYNLYSHATDGAGGDARITVSANTQVPNSIAPDGTIIAHEVRPQSKADLLRFTLSPGPPGVAAPATLVQTPFDEWNGEISPDGRFFAYQSNESGALDVYVRPFPDVATARWQVSSAGGRDPVWVRGGRELVYVDGSHHVISVPVDVSGTTFHTGAPMPWKTQAYSPGLTDAWRTYDVSADGQRALVLKSGPAPQEAAAASFVVVQNWFEELSRLLPAK